MSEMLIINMVAWSDRDYKNARLFWHYLNGQPTNHILSIIMAIGAWKFGTLLELSIFFA